MSAALTIRTTVLPGHRVEVPTPDLPVGETVEVTVTPRNDRASTGESIIDIIRSRGPDRPSMTKEEIDAYLNQERDSWER